jgi:prepilin-type N-terminal cleavage/methylation domain-containing protein
MLKAKNQNGFTLVEIAIVLLIVTILLGYTMAMVPIQQELKQYRQADEEMNKIIESVYAFAQVKGYLPCPAWVDSLTAPTVSSSGFECRENGGALDCGGSDPVNDSCDVWFGYVPGKTLGIEGRYSNVTGLLLDPWGKPYRYQVAKDANSVGGPVASSGNGNFIISGDMSKAGIANLSPDLSVCNVDPSVGTGNHDTVCTGALETIIAEAPAVIFSTGKDTNDKNDTTNSWVQRENLDNSDLDTVFVKQTFNHSRGAEFDDLVKWISPNILYSKMIDTGQLP